MCPVTLILWMGVIAMLFVFYQVISGQSSLGLGGVVMLVVMFFPNLFVSIFGAVLLKDLYFRLKRIIMWIALRARIKRLFRKPGRGVSVHKNAGFNRADER